jgi:uncharacterized protein (TIGR00369 family)
MSTSEAVRSRTITWDDPGRLAARGRELSGLELLKEIMAGEIPAPPIALLMGFQPIEVEQGRAVFTALPGPEHYSPLGAVHGGLAATLLDTVMACAVHTGLEAGVGYTTVELSLNYVRPITEATGPIRAEGRVVHLGSRIATAEGQVHAEGDGRLLAHGTTTILILRSAQRPDQDPSPRPAP